MQATEFLDQFQELSLPIHGVRLPTFVVEDSYKKRLDIKGEVDNYGFLTELCRVGFRKLKLTKDSEEHKKYADRVKVELGIIKELGFVDYILLVWDVIDFCDANQIPTGYGRGSAAGSLVLYLIGVTKVDPIKYGLYFERFISRIRAKKQIVDGITYLDGGLMCDVDLDICFYNRHKVIEYLDQKFKGRTCKILTFNTLSAKLLIKECGKTISGISDEEMGRVTELVPKLHGKVYDLKDAYEGIKKKDSDEWKLEPVKALVEWCDKNREVYTIALKLRDLIKNKGVHPSAISVSYGMLDEFTPTELDSDKGEVASYSMDWISLFNVKLDVLGLRGVSVVYDVCKQIGITMNDIDFENPDIYRQLQDFRNPHGIFQLEAHTNYEVACKVKPKNLEELAAVTALARPGAIQFVDQYANFTNFGQYEAIHPFFDSILQQSGGVAIYQEQMMQMAHKVGFTLDEAEILRRIVGKKKVEEVKAWQAKINDKINENHLEPVIAELLWKILEDSASYSFNKSHSVAYAALAAATIYLKFTYPTQFFLSLLRMSRHEPDSVGEISKIHKEMSEFGIKLLRPHLTKSKLDFSIEGKDIRFGLLSVRGISDKSIEKLNGFCHEYATKFEVFEAASEHGLNVGILCALIQAGAFEGGFKQSRTKVVYEAQLWNVLTPKEKKLVSAVAADFEYDLVGIVKTLTEKLDEKGKPLIKASRFETIKKKQEPFKAIFNMNRLSESFANWWYEKRLLGYTHGMSLKDIFIDKSPDLMSIREIRNGDENAHVYFVAYVDKDSVSRTSANGNKYLSFDVSDETGVINVKIFTKYLASSLELNNQKSPKEDNIVIVKGIRKDERCVFADLYAIQTSKIYTKLSDLRAEKLDKETKSE